MSSQERRWVWAYAIVLAALCSLPYMLGFFMAGERWAFSGFVFGVEDGNSYIAKMLAGSQGAWLFTTPYTTMNQRGELAFLPYLLLGKLAAGPALHLQLVALFHLFRIAATLFTVFAIYRFTTLFFESVRWRRWVTLMASIGGGLGWVLPLFGEEQVLGSLPLDFISPETFGFLAFFGLPHLILARGLMMLVFYRYLQSDHDHTRAWGTGWLLLLLTLVQSLSTLSIYAVIVVHQSILWVQDRLKRQRNYRKRWLPAALRTMLPSLPLILYYVIRFGADPFLRAWTEQNRILSPHPVHYGLAYGVLILLFFFALTYRPWREQTAWTLPLAWVIALPVLAYFPHNLQRRLVEGVWIALLLFGAYTLSRWTGEARRTNIIWLLVTTISLVSPLMLLVGGYQIASRPGRPVFIPKEQSVAFTWLQEHVEPGTIILGAYDTSNALPAWAPVVVPIGHGPESIDGEKLKPQVNAIYRSTLSKDQRLAWLVDQGVDYLYYGAVERTLDGWNPQQDDYLFEVYRSETVSIYEVLHADD